MWPKEAEAFRKIGKLFVTARPGCLNHLDSQVRSAGLAPRGGGAIFGAFRFSSRGQALLQAFLERMADGHRFNYSFHSCSEFAGCTFPTTG